MMKYLKRFEKSYFELNYELIDAIKYDSRVDKVRKLIHEGADINFVDPSDGMSLIMFAIESEREEIFKFLIDNKVDINHQDKDGLTPLMYAGDFNNWYMIYTLIDKGADWFLKNNLGQYFIDYLDEIYLNYVKEDYPEKYEDYLMHINSDKYNL